MRKHAAILTVVVMLLAVLLAACGSEKEAAPLSYTTLTVKQAYDQIGRTSKAVLVDVRTPEEWASQTGVPQGATLIQMADITAREQGAVPGLPLDQPIYVICNSGNRSRVVSEHLLKLGYKSVYNVDGGIQAWIREGLPTQVYTP